MPRWLTIIFFILMACTGRKERSLLIVDLEKQISDRRSIIKGLSKYNDQISLVAKQISASNHKILLLSKDVENFGSCVKLANTYYDSLAMHRTGYSTLQPLSVRMNTEEAEVNILQNELTLLNDLIFENSGADVRLFPVLENE